MEYYSAIKRNAFECILCPSPSPSPCLPLPVSLSLSPSPSLSLTFKLPGEGHVVQDGNAFTCGPPHRDPGHPVQDAVFKEQV